MRVLLPYTVWRPEVVRPLVEAVRFRAHDRRLLSPWVGKDELAYWRALCLEWKPVDDLMVVEHDVVIHSEVVQQFEECPHKWCVFGYDNICHPGCQDAWANMLGCTRFRKELIRDCPDALTGITDDTRAWANQDPRDWHNLCDSIAGDKVSGMPADLRPGSLRAAGFTHHWHTPPIHHISWEGHPR